MIANNGGNIARKLHLNVNITNVGRHDAAWHFVDSPDAFVSIDFYREIVRLAEVGTFDAVFLSDNLGFGEHFFRKPFQALDPIVLFSALAGASRHIGLIVTASTTYNDPFNLARRLASLDHVSGGRVAWNVITTKDAAAAANFGVDPHPSTADRYRRAEEFVEVANGLWDSWDDGAIIADRATHRFVDPGAVRRIDHAGKYFSVSGPLNLPRSPQGRPVIFQAGSSEGGRRLAARFADAVFTAQTDFDAAVRFRRDIHDRAAQSGRKADEIRILPGLFPIVGPTETAARQRKAALDEALDLSFERERFARFLGIEPDDLEYDKPVPLHLIDRGKANAGSAGFLDSALALTARDGATVRELLLNNPTAHRQLVGAPEQIADSIQHWFEGGAADGFNLNFDVFPDGLALFVEHVIPILRRRGLFRTAYDGTTLRDHLGLSRPQGLS